MSFSRNLSTTGAVLGVLCLLGAPQTAMGAAEMVATECRILDDCYCHASNGSLDPAEQVLLDVEFTNVGDAPAEEFSGSLVLVSGADLLDLGGSFAAVEPIEPGGVFSASIYYQVKVGCFEFVDVDITGLRTRSETFPDDYSICDYMVGESECTHCCQQEDIDPIWPVLAVKDPDDRNDVLLSWIPDPPPSASDYTTYTVLGAENRSEIPNAKELGPWPDLCYIDRATRCRDYGVVERPDYEIIYYQVRGVCGLIEAVE